jgi:hypothetical protein
MKRAAIVISLLLSANSAFAAGGFVLAEETIRFDAELLPQFSAKQMRATAEVTRAGLVRWAATAEGKAIIARVQSGDCEVIVIESTDEPTIGRAPQPGFLTLLAAGDRKQLKSYTLIVNPNVAAQYNRPKSIDLGLPRTPVDAMALAWAGEMLHIEFYAQGIALPHHQRVDFQERWQRVATALGMPRVEHVTSEGVDAFGMRRR